MVATAPDVKGSTGAKPYAPLRWVVAIGGNRAPLPLPLLMVGFCPTRVSAKIFTWPARQPRHGSDRGPSWGYPPLTGFRSGSADTNGSHPAGPRQGRDRTAIQATPEERRRRRRQARKIWWYAGRTGNLRGASLLSVTPSLPQYQTTMVALPPTHHLQPSFEIEAYVC